LEIVHVGKKAQKAGAKRENRRRENPNIGGRTVKKPKCPEKKGEGPPTRPRRTRKSVPQPTQNTTEKKKERKTRDEKKAEWPEQHVSCSGGMSGKQNRNGVTKGTPANSEG